MGSESEDDEYGDELIDEENITTFRHKPSEQPGKLHSDARNSLTVLHLLEKLNPIALKEERHMTAEDREKSAAFERTFERRKQAIQKRCNFYEIYRNKALFDENVFNQLIQKSLAKTPENDLPTEFQPFAKFFQNYERENPGKFAIALQFGKHVTGADTNDLMFRSDYSKAIGESEEWNPQDLKRGHMPEELQKAMDKYSERIQRQQVDQNEKVNELLSRLDESKKPLDRAEIDALVAMITELDDKPKTISEDQVISMTHGSGELVGKRWAREQN